MLCLFLGSDALITRSAVTPAALPRPPCVMDISLWTFSRSFNIFIFIPPPVGLRAFYVLPLFICQFLSYPQLAQSAFSLYLHLCPLPSSWLALFASVSDRTPPSDIIHTRAREPKSLRVAFIFTVLPLFPLLLFVLHLSLIFLFFTLRCHC